MNTGSSWQWLADGSPASMLLHIAHLTFWKTMGKIENQAELPPSSKVEGLHAEGDRKPLTINGGLCVFGLGDLGKGTGPRRWV